MHLGLLAPLQYPAGPTPLLGKMFLSDGAGKEEWRGRRTDMRGTVQVGW